MGRIFRKQSRLTTPQPFYFLTARTDLLTTSSGVIFLPWTLPFVLFIVATYIIVSRWNCWLLAIWIGWGLVLIGVSMSTALVRTDSNGVWVASAMILGTGVGVLYPSLHTASELMAAVEDEELTRRSVTNYAFFHLLGKAFGVGIAISVFQNQLLSNLKETPAVRDFAKVYAEDAVALVLRIRLTAGGEGSPKFRIIDAYVDSLKSVWIAMVILVVLAFVASFLGKPKEQQPEVGEVFVQPPKNVDKSYVV